MEATLQQGSTSQCSWLSSTGTGGHGNPAAAREAAAYRPRDRITAELTYELVQSLGAGQLEGAAGLFGFDLLLKTGGGILRPAFSRQTRSYEASVPANVTAVKMAFLGQTLSAFDQSGRAADGTPLAVRASNMTINRMKLGDTTIRNVMRRIVTFAGLQMGKNTIEIQTTAEDGITKGTYKVTVTRESEP